MANSDSERFVFLLHSLYQQHNIKLCCCKLLATNFLLAILSAVGDNTNLVVMIILLCCLLQNKSHTIHDLESEILNLLLAAG